MTTLGEADNNQTFTVRVGDTIQVSLPENASTGFRWAVDHYSDAVIEAVSLEPHYTDKAVGTGGDVVFTFKGKKAGSGDIELKYWRSFEGDKSATNRFRLNIHVQP
jgi:inhibitor of cysteine peptidase